MTNDQIRAGLDEAESWIGGRGLGANRTPQERKVAERAANEPPVPKWAKAMFDAKTSMIAEQAERIDEQADIIDQLHTANKHLAGRFDKVERQFAEWRSRQLGINQDVYRTIGREAGKLDRARKSSDNAADQRIQARAIELGRRIDGCDDVIKGNARALDEEKRARIAAARGNQYQLQEQIDRLMRGHPSMQQRTIRQQCDAVTFRGPTEEDNRE